MTYVLILSPNATNAWPAVIGGYLDRATAEEAGRVAIMAHLTQDAYEADGYGSADWAKWSGWAERPWIAFTVIPGNAASDQPPPSGEQP